MSIASAAAGINIARWLVAVTVLVALALTVYTVFLSGKFDIQQFGIGMAALLFGGGGMMYMNPQPQATPTGK